ncbi:MAG: hypothetical protein OEW04_00385 [Nitrospirota bacterium]|nr:hypothetical protein [Nitrospirota bacterium]
MECDFFWHLKTGEWIWQHKSLPSEDPFAYTTPEGYSERKHFILTSYWLSQIIYYLSYLAGGMTGIIFLRFIVVGLLIFLVLKRKAGDSILYECLLIIFIVFFLTRFSLERPHVYSFLFFPLILYLLDKIRDEDDSFDEKKKYLFLPLIMILWANMHGGYVLGQAVIVMYLVTEGLKFTHHSLKPLSKKIYIRLLLAGMLGILFSLANPNTYHAINILVSKTPATLNSYVIEYQTPFEDFQRGRYEMVLYWLLLVLTAIGMLVNTRKIDITELTLLAGTGYLSFTTIRYIPFFIIAAIPFIGKSLSKGSILKYVRIVIIVITIYSAIFFTWDERFNVYNISSNRWLHPSFPVYAADFIIQNNVKGNMYNFFDWGGYLIWRLAPERKVFIDGRANYPPILELSNRFINTADSESFAGLPYWKAILNTYNVSYIIHSLFDVSGEASPLLFALIQDNDWIPVFSYDRSMIFLRNSPENYQVLRDYAIPKDHFIDILIGACDFRIKTNPNDFRPYIARSDLYMFKGYYDEARKGYDKALKIAPFNPVLRNRLMIIEKITNTK